MFAASHNFREFCDYFSTAQKKVFVQCAFNNDRLNDEILSSRKYELNVLKILSVK